MEAKKADLQTSPKITATERRQTPSAFFFFFIPQFLTPLEHPPPPFFCNLVSDEVSLFFMWSQWKLSWDGGGQRHSTGVPSFGSLRKEQGKRGRRAQWQFGGSSRDCRIPQIRLRAQKSEREWDGHLGSIPMFLWWLLAFLTPHILFFFCFFFFCGSQSEHNVMMLTNTVVLSRLLFMFRIFVHSR